MLIADENPKSSTKHLIGWRMLRYATLMLDMYPILSRQIKSNHQRSFELHDDDDDDGEDDEDDDEDEAEEGADADADASRRERIRPSCVNDSNQDQHVPLIERLGAAKEWHRVHFAICMSVYLIELFRYLLIHLISLESLSEYHYLDCYILGRFRFIGRTNKISSFVMFVYLFAYIVYRYVIYILKPNFRFQALEFMLYTYKDVVENERQFRTSQAVGESFGLHDSSSNSSRGSVNGLESRFEVKPNGTFYLLNLFCNDSTDCKWILRPNRTGKSWTTLSNFASIAYYSLVVVSIFFVFIMSYTFAGSIFTNLGYEMGYPTCVAYIQDRQRNSEIATLAGNYTTLGDHSELAYSHIYLAPAKLAHQISIEDIPAIIPVTRADLQPLTTYNVLRISVDVFENIFWYMEFLILFSCAYFIVIVFSLDIMINAKEVQKRLKRLIGKMKDSRSSPGLSYDHQNGPFRLADLGLYKKFNFVENTLSTIYGRYRPGPGPRPDYPKILSNCKVTMANWNAPKEFAGRHEFNSTILQAILVDHFILVCDYNRLMSFYFKNLFHLFLEYSLLIMYWTSTVKSRTVEFEFVIAEATLTMIVVTYCSTASMARSANLHLYKLIAQAMALDTNIDSRRRWVTIMNYYKPQPLYCYTLIGSTEISWLFCLKVSCSHWLGSLMS